MKNFLVLVLLIVFLTPNAVFAKATPVKRDGMTENDYILDEMLPNPSIYLYGVDSNGFPLLLMNFSLTIPIFAIDDNPLLRPFQFLGRFAPTFHKKTKSLKSITMYLKIKQSPESADGKLFYYKIIKLQCDQEQQNIDYKDNSEWKLHVEGGYTQGGGSGKGSVDRNMAREMKYLSKLPIRDYSGVGSDTLKIMLKRGRKYPIRAGHMNVSMVVAAIPYYKNPPLSYCGLRCNNGKYDFVRDFMTVTNPENPCVPTIRKVYFGKTYTDNSIMNYYEVTPENNPNKLLLESEVVMGNRINGCPILSSYTTTTAKIFKNLNKTPSDPCCKANSTDKTTPERACKETQTLIDDCATTTRSVEDSYGLILNDNQFMYDNIFTKQLQNTESVSTSGSTTTSTSTTKASTPAAAAAADAAADKE